MQRRELVPIREALGALDGPAKAIRDALTPGASLQGSQDSADGVVYRRLFHTGRLGNTHR